MGLLDGSDSSPFVDLSRSFTQALTQLPIHVSKQQKLIDLFQSARYMRDNSHIVISGIGYDAPLYQARYARYLENALSGMFGMSIKIEIME